MLVGETQLFRKPPCIPLFTDSCGNLETNPCNDIDFKKSDYLIYTGDFTSFTLPWKCFYNPLISLIRKPKKKKTWKVRPGMTFHG